MKKSIGILGGMSPIATVDLFEKIVMHTRADCDQEHARVIIDNHPQTPDRFPAMRAGTWEPMPCMLESVRNLERCGAGCILLPCNTAHYFVPHLQKETDVPFLDMPLCTARACAQRYPGVAAGVLAAQGTYWSGLYRKTLAECGVECIEPDDADKDILMRMIYDLKADKSMLPYAADMLRIMDYMQKRGAGIFILGCTELPIIAKILDWQGVLVDSTLELAKAAITFCGYTVKE